VRKLNVLITTIGLAAFAPLASAGDAFGRTEQLPRAGGAEITQYANAVTGSNQADAFFYATTSGVSPQ